MAMVTVSHSIPDLINEITLTTHFGQANKVNKKQLKLEPWHINIAITQASKYEILWAYGKCVMHLTMFLS